MRSSLRLTVLAFTMLLAQACSGYPPASFNVPEESPIASPTAVASASPSTSAAETTTEGPSPDASSSPIPSELLAQTGQPSAPAPTPDPQPSKTQYSLTAELNYGTHLLSVREKISFTNPVPEEIPDLALIVEPSRYPAVFHLKSLAWGNGTPVDNFAQEIGYLRIPLRKPLQPGESLDLTIEYELNLPSPDPAFYGRPVPFGYTSSQTNLVDWYPFLPPYRQGQGWWTNQAGPFGEHLVYETADFKVDLRLLDERSDLIIAASAPATLEDGWYHYLYPASRNFVWSVSHLYQVETRQAGPVTVKAYTFPVHGPAGAAALQATVEALELNAELLGPYRRELLSLVEADFLDGMEYDGLYFLSKGFYNLYGGTPGEYLTAIAAHETTHQWWYAQVGNDQAIEPWLDEALSTYGERLYYERFHPEALEWWWEYRINYYEPKGWVDGTIYNPEGFRAYRDAIYLNGALFLEDLRTRVGDTDFFAFLADYAQSNAGRIATADDFFSLLDEQTEADITDLLGKYFSKR